MISRVQRLPTCHVVSGSDLEDVAGGLPNAEGMYSALFREIQIIHQKLNQKIQEIRE